MNSPDTFQSRLDEFLRRRGLKATQQRELILRAFVAAGTHLSVEELWNAVRRLDPGIGHATIYRTVRLFVDAGLANERRFADGASKYEPAGVEEHHDHLICTRCGRIVEFEDAEIERRQDVIAERFGYRLAHHKMELYGLCPTCAPQADR